MEGKNINKNGINNTLRIYDMMIKNNYFPKCTEFESLNEEILLIKEDKIIMIKVLEVISLKVI